MIVETTVPPGTCEKWSRRRSTEALRSAACRRGRYSLAHAYERVMPGPEYFDSIVNYWRVFAGHTDEAAEAGRARSSPPSSTSSEYPLTRLVSTTASETAKVMENTLPGDHHRVHGGVGPVRREAGIDLFEAIDAIRMRPTHANMRQPGFGVGGYCLTKDPLFAKYGARELLGFHDSSSRSPNRRSR